MNQKEINNLKVGDIFYSYSLILKSEKFEFVICAHIINKFNDNSIVTEDPDGELYWLMDIKFEDLTQGIYSTKEKFKLSDDMKYFLIKRAAKSSNNEIYVDNFMFKTLENQFSKIFPELFIF